MLSAKAQKAMNTIVDKIKSGDIGPVVKVAKIKQHPDDKIPSTKWTFSNRVLAMFQTGSLDCRGYRQWQQVGRQVQKGSQAAYILGPCTRTVEKENGEDETIVYGFRSIAVFPKSATSGDELPDFDYRPVAFPPLFDVAQGLGIEVEWKPAGKEYLGYCDVSGKAITLGSYNEKTWFHELAHAIHAHIAGELKPGQDCEQETIADFSAMVLAELYNLDYTGNCWLYISRYNDDPFKAVMGAFSTVEKIIEFLENFGEGDTDD
jgi:hypothetical protein